MTPVLWDLGANNVIGIRVLQRKAILKDKIIERLSISWDVSIIWADIRSSLYSVYYLLML